MTHTLKQITTLLVISLELAAGASQAGRLGPLLHDPISPANKTTIGDGSDVFEENSLTFSDIYPLLAPIIVLLCCGYAAMKEIRVQRDLRATRQTMTQRRQQQRESGDQVMSAYEKGNDDARYDLFIKNFHFQTVLSDTSDITAESVRNANAGKEDEECRPTDTEETELKLEDKPETPSGQDEASFPGQWYRFSSQDPKEECVICLQSYIRGETICTPITTSCTHVFHKDCMYEWVKTKDRCPVCRSRCLEDCGRVQTN